MKQTTLCTQRSRGGVHLHAAGLLWSIETVWPDSPSDAIMQLTHMHVGL